MKKYFDSLDDFINSASLVSGSALGSYLAISVGQSGKVSAAIYVDLTFTFLAGFLVVSLMNFLPRMLLLGLYRPAAQLGVLLLAGVAMLLLSAWQVGIDPGLVGSALVAWLVVPIAALYWGIQMKRETPGDA